jgi:hypothetical protein
MQLTGFPFWKLDYGDDFKIAGHLSESQEFIQKHEVDSISFYVNVMCTQPGVGGTEKTFARQQMTKDELLSLSPEWLKQKMEEVGKEANAYFFPLKP